MTAKATPDNFIIPINMHLAKISDLEKKPGSVNLSLNSGFGFSQFGEKAVIMNFACPSPDMPTDEKIEIFKKGYAKCLKLAKEQGYRSIVSISKLE